MNLTKEFVLAAFLAMLPLVGNAETSNRSPQTPSGKPALQEQSADLRALITTQLAAGKKTITIPPGRYRVKPEAGGHLTFRNLNDVEIIAHDVEMVCTATVRAIGFEQCTNVTLRGLTVDYDPLPFTQGKIVALGKDKSWVEFELIAGYPENQLVGPIEIFDPVTRELRRASYYGWDDFERVGPRRYRVSKGPKYRYRAQVDIEEVGDILITKNRFPDGRMGHAILLTGCADVKLEDVTLYASPTFGFLEQDCTSSTYLRCKVDRRDPADDPVKRGMPRLRSLNADAFHSKTAPKGPAIISCTARFQGDDCVNINGRYYYVLGASGKAVRLVAFESPAIAAGEPVEFLPYDGPRPPNAMATGIRPLSVRLTEAEKAFIKRLKFDERIQSGLLGSKAVVYELTLDREVSLAEGSAVCSAARVGNGFVVKDCDFGDNRSRGVLIKASQGEVAGNRISRTRMAAVLVTPEFYWMEAACSSDVVVQDNIIKGSSQTAIRVWAEGGKGLPLPAGAHRNISILRNRFEDCAWPLIEVSSTSDLTIEGNIWPKEPPPAAAHTRAFPPVPVVLKNCETRKTSP